MDQKQVDYKVSFRKVRYPRLEFRTKELLVVLPPGYDPDFVLSKHKRWILRKSQFIKECLKDSAGKEICNRAVGDFKSLVFSCIERISKELGVEVNKVMFRKMRTKWASCSSRKNLTFNTLMKHLPEKLIEYVVFHEATHLIERGHKERFWNIISKYFDNHDELEKELFTYWFLIQEVKSLGGA